MAIARSFLRWSFAPRALEFTLLFAPLVERAIGEQQAPKTELSMYNEYMS